MVDISYKKEPIVLCGYLIQQRQQQQKRELIVHGKYSLYEN